MESWKTMAVQPLVQVGLSVQRSPPNPSLVCRVLQALSALPALQAHPTPGADVVKTLTPKHFFKR